MCLSEVRLGSSLIHQSREGAWLEWIWDISNEGNRPALIQDHGNGRLLVILEIVLQVLIRGLLASFFDDGGY